PPLGRAARPVDLRRGSDAVDLGWRSDYHRQWAGDRLARAPSAPPRGLGGGGGSPHLSRGKGATMAGGWTRDGAVQDQIDDTVKDAVLPARAHLRRLPGRARQVGGSHNDQPAREQG